MAVLLWLFIPIAFLQILGEFSSLCISPEEMVILRKHRSILRFSFQIIFFLRKKLQMENSDQPKLGGDLIYYGKTLWELQIKTAI